MIIYYQNFMIVLYRDKDRHENIFTSKTKLKPSGLQACCFEVSNLINSYALVLKGEICIVQ